MIIIIGLRELIKKLRIKNSNNANLLNVNDRISISIKNIFANRNVRIELKRYEIKINKCYLYTKKRKFVFNVSIKWLQEVENIYVFSS